MIFNKVTKGTKRFYRENTQLNSLCVSRRSGSPAAFAPAQLPLAFILSGKPPSN